MDLRVVVERPNPVAVELELSKDDASSVTVTLTEDASNVRSPTDPSD
jgi:hypothetical protein